jgi:AcrR family transcriptional regulator
LARPLSEGKRNAILASAAKAVAESGVSAATAKIAIGAGIAEGTLFSYFETKDALLNQLFIQIRHELGAAILVDFRSGNSLSDVLRHAWDRYIE